MQPVIEHLVVIPGPLPTPVCHVGGKANSLQRMAAAGLPIPPAHVLATGFFQPWFDTLTLSPVWQSLLVAQPEQWQSLCDTLKAQAVLLSLSAMQQLTLSALRKRLYAQGGTVYFAVRSSSPDEDASTASFAGIYETVLGVASDGIEEALRRCFASCLDHRVLVYMQAKGMALFQPRIAVIVQDQLDSEVAGVGFSINPLTNDYDECAIDANWGLGESVVSGMTSSDHFIVNKVSGAVLERHMGAKQLAVTLVATGGTATGANARSSGYCLTDAQLHELNAIMCRLELLYDHPVDMEWAYSRGQLSVLQARPITTYVPLPPEMMSAPGERRVLYMDIALSKGMTSNAPISPIGLDWLRGDMSLMLKHCVGNVGLDLQLPGGLLFLGGGRMHMNLSNLLWFSSPKQLAKGSAATDALMADILSCIDMATYRAARRPAWIMLALRIAPLALWRLRRTLWRALRTVVAPEGTYRHYWREKLAYEARYAGAFDNSLPLEEFQRRYGAAAIANVIDIDMPALGIGVLAVALAQRLANRRSAEEQALAEQLSRGISGNLVVDMGIRIFRMARMLDAGQCAHLETLATRIAKREMPSHFLCAWDAFISDYGCRGPGEMDLANAHYADDPMMVLRQMSFMAGSAGDFDPEAAHQRLAAQREQAYQMLMQRFGLLRRALLRRVNTLIELFGGTRDTPKFHNLLYQHAARKRLLVEGHALVASGRLDRPEQVFDLTVADLAAAASDAGLDLRELGRQRTSFNKLLAARVRTFPAVIDSRGRILRGVPRNEKPGELKGTPVSPGKVTGRVKVLHSAHEKTISDGDILVAFTTDPGWTPLFVNAAAIVLEVGGVLQHGAVVAREYGKPCVVGIVDVLDRLRDGQTVEVDGSTGVVRVIADADVGNATRH